MLLGLLLLLPFLFIGGFWNDIWGGVRDNLGGLVFWVRDRLSAVANNIWDALMAVGRSVGDAGNWIVHNVWERLGNLMQVIWDASDRAWRGVAYSLGGVANFIRDAGDAVWSHVTFALGGVVNIIHAAGESVWQHVTFALGGIANFIHDAGESVWQHVTFALGGIANTIGDGVRGLTNKLWDRLGDLLGGVQDVAGKVDDLPGKAIDTALDHKEELLSVLVGGPAGLLVLKSVQELAEHHEAIADALRIDGQHPEQWAGNAFDSILKLMTGTGRIEPEDAPDVIARALGVATAFGIAARVPGIIQGFIPTEDPTATSDLAAFLARFAGWDHIIDAGLGTASSLALRRPMDSLLNKRSLTNEPRTSDASALYSRRFIDDATFDETMHRDGFPDDWGVPFRESSYRPLRKFELAMLAAAQDLPDNVLTTFLQRAGYAPEVIPILADGLHATTTKSAATAWLTEARSAYRDGFIDLAAFGAVMDAVGLSPAEQSLWVMAAQADYVNSVKTEMLSAFRSAAARDALVDDELRAGLAQLGLTTDKIEVEVARANIARLKKPVDEVAAEQRAAVNKARADMTQAYSLQFRKGAIDEQTFLAALIFIGVPEVQARAVVALAKAQSLEVPPAVPVDTPEMARRRTLKDLQDAYVLQYQHDLIDARTLEAALVGTGMVPYEANAIVLREQARKTPSPVVANVRTEERVIMEVQQALAAAYAQQYQEGYITADELEANLAAAGFDPRVAQSRRRLEESKAHGLATKARDVTESQAQQQLQKADQAVAVEAFRKGVITADALEARLVDIGLSPGLAGSIRDLEQLRALPKPPTVPTPAELKAAAELQTAEVTAAREAYRKGVITADALETALVNLGLSLDLAAAIRKVEQYRALPTPTTAPTAAELQAQRELQRVQQAAAVEAFRKGLLSPDRLEVRLIAIGLSPDLAAATRDLEEVRATPGPPATPTPAEVQAQRQLLRVQQATAVEAFRKGLIVADELESALVDIGLGSDLAYAVRQYEEIHSLPAPTAAEI